MKQKMRKILTTVTLVLSCGATAQAGTTFVTPLARAEGGQITECVVTNFGTQPAVLGVCVFDSNGTCIDTSTLDTCNTGPLASGATCITRGDVFEVGCRVVSSSRRVRVALEARDAVGGNLQVMFPATRR
jgi:hypothetical protein